MTTWIAILMILFLSLKPLWGCNIKGDAASEWKQAYQKVKHDRVANCKEANLKNCIMSLGALFILNVYLKNPHLDHLNYSQKDAFDPHLGSNLFVVTVDEDLSTSPKQASIESIVRIRINNDQRARMNKAISEVNKKVGEIAWAMAKKALRDDNGVEPTEEEIGRVAAGIDYQALSANQLKASPVMQEFNHLIIEIALNK